MIRGIERRRIFLCPADEEDFLERLDHLLPDEGWSCFAWALMPNHVHLVIQSAEGRLSRLMARLNTGYARSFNLRHDRSGYLFQNRFKSRLVDNEADLQGLVRYVLRNPLEGGLVPDLQQLETYPGCGYGALVGRRSPRPFEATRKCLALFEGDRATRRSRLQRWMAEGESLQRPTDDWPAAAANADRTRLTEEAEPRERRPREIEIILPHTASPDSVLTHLTGQLGTALGVAAEGARAPGGRGGLADLRSIVCSTAVDRLRLPRQVIADHLGISPTAVSHAARKGRTRLREAAIRIDIHNARPPCSKG